MKIVGIVCSPRKEGNTEILVKEALDAARGAGAQTELLLISEMTINPCLGCFSCVASGVCKQEDDMQKVYKEFEEADGIIFGTPVYFINVTAQAKAVIDRTFALYIKRKLKDKVAAPIVTLRRVGGGAVLGILYQFFNTHEMFISKRNLGYGSKKGEVKEGVGGDSNMSAMEEAREVGKQIVAMAARVAKMKQ